VEGSIKEFLALFFLSEKPRLAQREKIQIENRNKKIITQGGKLIGSYT
jgi:hypothetical protein